jgi:hypothetical protein
METKPTTAQLIAEGAKIKTRLATDTERLKEINAQLVKLAPGTHEGDEGASCQVIAPASAIKLDATKVDQVKEITGDDAFKKLFDRKVSFSAVKAFRELLAALVTGKRDQKKVLELTEQPGTTYVKWA